MKADKTMTVKLAKELVARGLEGTSITIGCYSLSMNAKTGQLGLWHSKGDAWYCEVLPADTVTLRGVIAMLETSIELAEAYEKAEADKPKLVNPGNCNCTATWGVE